MNLENGFHDCHDFDCSSVEREPDRYLRAQMLYVFPCFFHVRDNWGGLEDYFLANCKNGTLSAGRETNGIPEE